MKTKVNISNLKKMVITLATGIVLTSGSFASSIPAKNEEMASANKLDALMTATEQSVRFVAPAVEESEDVFYAIEELNTLAETTEASVKYVAPAVEETEEVAEAIQGLDELAASTEVAVAFRAPRADDSIESASTENQESNLMLANEIK